MTKDGMRISQAFALIKDTPYLALTGEPWGVFHEYFAENRWL